MREFRVVPNVGTNKFPHQIIELIPLARAPGVTASYSATTRIGAMLFDLLEQYYDGAYKVRGA